MGRRVRHDDCADRCNSETQRIRMWQRQYATTHRDYLAAAQRERETTDADERTKVAKEAGDALGRLVQLAEWIATARAEQDAILDEHNAHTAGTYEHSIRPPHLPVKEPA